MASFVLVHGGWHGGWCWRKVTPLLRATGHEVYAPTLTGLGERAHLSHPAIDLSTHVQDVVNVLEYEDLDAVVLVGHSLGGMVIAGVAERVPGRLAHLVYLDAFVPEDGQAAADILNSRAQTEERLHRDPAERVGVGSMAFLGVGDAPDVRWLQPRLVPHPRRTFLEPVRLGDPGAARLARTYIWCTETTFRVAPLDAAAGSGSGGRAAAARAASRSVARAAAPSGVRENMIRSASVRRSQSGRPAASAPAATPSATPAAGGTGSAGSSEAACRRGGRGGRASHRAPSVTAAGSHTRQVAWRAASHQRPAVASTVRQPASRCSAHRSHSGAVSRPTARGIPRIVMASPPPAGGDRRSRAVRR
jgi:pimeloyl-ACP methyl ester carboxylesterase